MDCLTAREIISEAFDRGVAEVPQAAEAREHCRACVECRRFVEGLAVLRKTPAPAAPPELIEAIVERGRMMAEAGLPRAVPKPEEIAAGEEPAPAAEALQPPLETPPRRPERDAWWWVPRIGAAAAAVAVASFALVLSFQGFRALRPQPAGAPTDLAMPGASYAPSAPVEERASGAAKSVSPAGSPAGGPRYIAFADEAYAWVGVRSPDPGALTAAEGQVTSSLDSTAPPTQRQVWRSKTDPDIVFVRSNETSETYVAFRRVARTYGGKLYSMWAGEVTRFGQWPGLPSQFATPTAGDGSPTFVSAGKDDSGLEIFAPPGASAELGFAVPPSTSTGDAAAGDPRWTWWLPRK